MENFAKMDIFFAVTTAAVVVLTLLIALVAYRIAVFVRVLERIASEVQEEAEEIRTDLVRLRSDIAGRGSALRPLLAFVTSFGKRVVTKKLVRKKK